MVRKLLNRTQIAEALRQRGRLREAGGGATVGRGSTGATTTANVGAFEVPLGSPLTRVSPAGEPEDLDDVVTDMDYVVPPEYRASFGLPERKA
jgi:hypothetical protein